MSIRSIIIGIVLACVMCASCYFNDYVVRPGTMIAHLLPAVAYGGLVLCVMLINPLLRLFGARVSFKGREVAAILALFLISCGIPGWSLGQMFPGTVMFPHYDNKINPSWSAMEVLNYAPQQMLCDASGDEGEAAVVGYITGMGEGDKHIKFTEVPWKVWRRPFLFWGPIVFSFLLGIFGLAIVFHKQWSKHEQLPYPIIQFASSLLPDENGRLAAVFKNKLFIIGFVFGVTVLLNNYLCRFFPQQLIPVKMNVDISPFAQLCPTILRGKGGMMFWPQFIYTVIGLAYFLPSEASFSMWIGPWLYCLVGGIFATYGIELRSARMMGLQPEVFIFAGGYFGILLIILYTGRQYYKNTLKRALFRKTDDDIPGYAVAGMRMFIIGMIVFVTMLHIAGVHWTIGILYAIISVMVYTVVSRVLAETGAFEIGTYVYPCVVLWGLFGETALGPKVLVTLFLVSTVLLAAPGWCVMPFLNHAMKLSEGNKVSLNKTASWGVIVMILAILVSIPATIYWQYDRGALIPHWPRASSIYPFLNCVEIVNKLRAQGLEEFAMAQHGWSHWQNMSPYWNCIWTFLVSTGLALLVAFGRLKWTWWPLHPVIFIFYGGHQGMLMSFSFGLGFFLKWIFTKYGGGRVYQRSKPLFIGLIAGTLMGQFIPMIVGTLYYVFTGQTV